MTQESTPATVCDPDTALAHDTEPVLEAVTTNVPLYPVGVAPIIVMSELTGIVVLPEYVQPGRVVNVAVAVEPVPERVAVWKGP